MGFSYVGGYFDPPGANQITVFYEPRANYSTLSTRYVPIDAWCDEPRIPTLNKLFVPSQNLILFERIKTFSSFSATMVSRTAALARCDASATWSYCPKCWPMQLAGVLGLRWMGGSRLLRHYNLFVLLVQKISLYPFFYPFFKPDYG